MRYRLGKPSRGCAFGKLIVLANSTAWSQPSQRRLAGLSRKNGFVSPLFDGEHETETLETIENGRVTFRRDLLFDVFWLATGQEEPYYPKERHGFNQLKGRYFIRSGYRFWHWSGKSLPGLKRHLETGLSETGAPLAEWEEGGTCRRT